MLLPLKRMDRHPHRETICKPLYRIENSLATPQIRPNRLNIIKKRASEKPEKQRISGPGKAPGGRYGRQVFRPDFYLVVSGRISGFRYSSQFCNTLPRARKRMSEAPDSRERRRKNHSPASIRMLRMVESGKTRLLCFRGVNFLREGRETGGSADERTGRKPG